MKSLIDISSVFGTKSYSTAGYTCTILPRLPLTFKFKISASEGIEVRGLIENLWLRSWNTRPYCAVFIAKLSVKFKSENIRMVGLFLNTYPRLCALVRSKPTLNKKYILNKNLKLIN